MSVIRIENIGKRYLLNHQVQGNYRKTLRESIGSGVRSLLGRNRSQNRDPSNLKNSSLEPVTEDFWALKDISCQIHQGERVGIIGRNGAGKSTLLKILSRITEPTTGEIFLKGRVASLLEVGTGFHPELTGRENIFLNGSVLGMSKAEIRRKFDEIVSFAEVEKFLDTPVKRYSSGMYVRLAFAVAAHLEPEILIVDEVLAVGDAAFQKKCLGKMETVAREGRTILFVSHNMAAIQSLCSRALWLEQGELLKAGDAGQVVSQYLQTSFSSVTQQQWDEITTAPGNDKVRIHRACVRPTAPIRPAVRGDSHALDSSTSHHKLLNNNASATPITVETPFVIEFEYWNLQPGARLNLSLHLYNEQGIMVFNALPISETTWQGKPFPVGLFRDRCYIPGNLMNDGIHSVELLVVKDDTLLVYKHSDILAFDVRDAIAMRGAWYGKWAGAVRPQLDWTTERIGATLPQGAMEIAAELWVQ